MITMVRGFRSTFGIVLVLAASIYLMGISLTLGGQMEKNLDNLLLSESEMGDYSLIGKRVAHFPVGENIIKEGIEQKWRTPEGEELFYQIVSFRSRKEAREGGIYYATHMATPFTQGSFSGIALGDKCWKAKDLGLGLLTVRRSFIIFVGKVVYKEGDEWIIEQIMEKILLKIGDATGN
jgi:hypothetical protein